MKGASYIIFLICCCFACGTHGSGNRAEENEIPVEKPEAGDSLYAFFPPEGTVIEIDLDHLQTGPRIPVKEIFSGMEQVVPAGEEKFSPGVFFRMDCGESSVFVLDLLTASVIRYDRNGNYMNRIGGKGEKISNGEYKKPADIAVDTQHKFVYVMEPVAGRVLRYTYGGEYIGSFPVLTGNYAGFPSEDVVTTICRSKICDFIKSDRQGNVLIHYAYWDGNRSPYNYLLVSQTGKKITARKTFREFAGSTANLYGYKYEVHSYYYKGRLHVKDLSDTLYYVDNGKLIPKYHFTTRESLSNNVTGKNFCKEGGSVEYIFETEKYLIFTYQGKYKGEWGEEFMGYYDKSSGLSYRLKNKYNTEDPESILFETDDLRYYFSGFNYCDGKVAYRMTDGGLCRYFIE